MHRRAATAVHSAGSGDSGTVFHGASRGVVREQPDPEGLAGIREERGPGRVGGRYAAAGVRRYTLAGDSILRMTSKRQQSSNLKHRSFKRLGRNGLQLRT